MADAAAETADAVETVEAAAETPDALETVEAAAETPDALETEEVMADANLEARCIPFAIEWYLFWHLQVFSPPHLHLQGGPASAPQTLS